ncbi:hypothetical protein [Rhizobium sp. HT1-10]|uniref:hypothetical protein n=1 Tax=Rhizobium sp. HT1-10 TaxID=3111638 RepID=UPI003C2AA63A
MYLKNLLAAAGKLEGNMPVEIEELASELVLAGFQDSIIFHPEDVDPATVQGVFYQYTTHSGVYSAPEFVTLIVFSQHLDMAWQRLVCGKELIHVCDTAAEQTNTEDELEALLDKVLGPLSTEDFGIADLMAAKDKLAIYQALAILFPLRAREEARAHLNAGSRTVEQVALWAALPVPLVNLVVSDDWPSFYEFLVDGWGA